jgi:transposase-like protein
LTISRYLSDREICERFDIVKMTLWRWRRDLGFPKGIKPSGDSRSPNRTAAELIEAWEAERSNQGAAA